jgi:hypothetical protein
MLQKSLHSFSGCELPSLPVTSKLPPERNVAVPFAVE